MPTNKVIDLNVPGELQIEDWQNPGPVEKFVTKAMVDAGIYNYWNFVVSDLRTTFHHVKRNEEVEIDNSDINRWGSYEKECPGILATKLKLELYS